MPAMILRPAQQLMRPLVTLAVFICLAARLPAAPAGPTLHFDYGTGQPLENPLNAFMYFVPLISPDPVSVFTNAGNTQCARVVSFTCRTNGSVFHAIAEFEFVGTGVERNIFDHAAAIRRHDGELKAGKPLAHQLAAISVQGAGSGSVEIEGTLTNGQPTVIEVRLRFNRHGHPSPVSISLHDLVYRAGGIVSENESGARVTMLAFRQQPGTPKMEVTLDSVKAKDAGDGLWSTLVGGLKGVAVNLFLPPLTVTADGHQAMMDFGLALALNKPVFTFPFATRLKASPATAP